MNFRKFIITAEPHNQELISGILWSLDIEGIEEKPDKLEVFAGFKSKITAEEIRILLENLVSEKIISSFKVEEELIRNKNWNEEWEKKINVIEVSPRIKIKPTFKKYIPGKDQIVIEINPKMSFGTGEHQTTKLMLCALEKYIKGGEKILDVGTGTGILAITAVKLGAASAIGIDNDEWSCLNARENCVINKTESKTEIRMCEINEVKENNFDLIASNIQKNTLIEIAGELRSRLKENGILILSGLLTEDEPEIRSEYRKLGFNRTQVMRMDEWLALIFNFIPSP